MSIAIFLLAGYETTSTALSYCFYVLAKHPSEMIKLQNEIDSAFANLDLNVLLSVTFIFLKGDHFKVLPNLRPI